MATVTALFRFHEPPNARFHPNREGTNRPSSMIRTDTATFHTKQWFENDARNDAMEKPGGNNGISYHGGLVLRRRHGGVLGLVRFRGGPAVGTNGAGVVISSAISNLGG